MTTALDLLWSQVQLDFPFAFGWAEVVFEADIATGVQHRGIVRKDVAENADLGFSCDRDERLQQRSPETAALPTVSDHNRELRLGETGRLD